ncbi:MAG: DUF2515 family protein, partial [Gemmataceae bacterium]
ACGWSCNNPGYAASFKLSSTTFDHSSLAYAELFLSNPNVYIWAGLAAHASANAGKAMGLAEFAVPLMANSNTIRGMLAAGNQAIFDDIYWQFLAYEYGGIILLNHFNDLGALADDAYNGWVLIHEGATNHPFPDMQKIAEGNFLLLDYEQRKVLQPVIDYDNNPFYALIASRASPYVNSPLHYKIGSITNRHDPFHVAFETESFNDYIKRKYQRDGDFQNIDDRMDWIVGSMWPQWLKLLEDDTAMKSVLDRFEFYR